MSGFADQIATFSAKTDDKIKRIVTRSIQETGVTLQSFTPVKTGRLKANQNYSAEAPDLRVTANTNSTGINNIGDIPANPLGIRHYIATGIPYAGYVEFGTSKFAGRRMFGLTAQGFQGIVDRVVKEVAP